MGEAFVAELNRRKLAFTPLSRREVDYSRFDVLLNFLRERKPTFVINAAGYIGKPNVDACENAKAETLLGNVVLPVTMPMRVRRPTCLGVMSRRVASITARRFVMTRVNGVSNWN